MGECDNLVNIEASPANDPTVLKRKLDGSSGEFSFPCKKIAVLPKSNSSDILTTPLTPSALQVKLTKAEREAMRMEKAKERDMERQKREQERTKREEEKQKREEERMKKVCDVEYQTNQ